LGAADHIFTEGLKMLIIVRTSGMLPAVFYSFFCFFISSNNSSATKVFIFILITACTDLF